jgi:hypothetical protein
MWTGQKGPPFNRDPRKVNVMESKHKRAATSGFSNRDLGLLTWMGEQYGARIDHVQALTRGISIPMVWRIVRQMRVSGFVKTERIVANEPTWAIPTATGLAVCGHPHSVWTPALGKLGHVGAINDVRIHVQEQRPESEWICERQLELEVGRSAKRGNHIPDGVLILEGRSVAVEVELNPKTPEKVGAVLDHHSKHFDAILYYCAPKALRLLRKLEQTGRWPKLTVRELPLPPHLRER